MPPGFILSVVASREATSLTAADIARARDLVEGGEVRILSPGEAAEIACGLTAPDPGAIRAGGRTGIDLLITPRSARRKRLLLADMDSTVVTGETLDELAVFAGVGEHVAAVTRRSMNGEIGFEAALRERVALLRGLPVAALERTLAATALTPGARTLVGTMRANGARCVLVSGGFTWFTSRIAAACGFDEHHANRLEEADGRLTGTVGEPILGRSAKRRILGEITASLGLAREHSLAVGDGANDLEMLADAGLGVAFHAKPVVRAAVAAQVNHADLRALLFVQGYAAAEFRDTDG